MLLPANGSQSVRSTGLNLPASTANVGSLRSSSTVKVFVAQRQAEDTLPNQSLDLMLDIARVASIDEAGGKAPHQPDALVNLPQQQRAGVRGNVPAIETGHH